MKKFKIILILIAIIFIVFLIKNYNEFDFFNKSEKIYKQGLEFTKNKDYQNAFYNFSQVSKYSNIYIYALFRQGMSADALNDSKTAIEKYNKFLQRYPDTLLSQKAAYNLAYDYFKEKNYSESKRVFKYLQKNFPKSDFAIAANYYLGLIIKYDQNNIIEKKENSNKEEVINNLKTKSLNYFISYLNLSPNGRFAPNCLKEISQLNIPLSRNEKKIIGIANYKNNNYKKAIKYLDSLEDKSDIWPYLLLSYKKVGNYGIIKQNFNNWIKLQYQKNDQDEKALKEYRSILYAAIDAYIDIQTIKNPEDKSLAWKNLLKYAYLKNIQAEDYILYKASKYLNKKDNIKYYKRIVDEYPQDDFASEALWELFWYYYQNNSYKTAFIYGKKHISKYTNTQAAPRILFWMGKIAQKEQNVTLANNYFNQVISKYPIDYYAFRAHKNIEPQRKEKIKPLIEKNINPQFPINYANLNPENMSIVMKIMELGDYELLKQIEFESKFVDSWIHYQLENYSKSVNLAKLALEELETKPLYYDEVYKLAYPIHYAQKINSYSAVWNLDPYIIISIIREESFFNKRAKSLANARGLMQLMPSTARYIASKYNLRYQSLYDLEDNLKLSTAYFHYVSDQMMDNNMILSVASYNSGPNILKYWLSKSNTQDIDEFIENIPYFETKHYVRKVFASYWNYTNIYR